MSELNFGKAVSLKQACEIILATPQNRYLLQGEPGIGKSSIMKMLGQKLPEYELVYIDVPNMDLGDIAMPVINHDTKTTAYYPNAQFKLHLKTPDGTPKPSIMMYDEFTKGAQPVMNMLHPSLEVHNPRLGDLKLNPQSIIFLTGNLSSDGVGDNLKAHSRNRIIPLPIRKPDADEWVEWALNNDIAPEVIAWVRQFPQCLESYTSGNQDENPYIYQPRKMQTAFVSPRSLERVSNILKKRKSLDSDSLICAMTGAIGEAASRDMQAYVEYADQLPEWESIIKSPKTALVPDTAGASAIVVFSGISRVDKSSIDKFMDYIERFAPEWQACFAINIAKNPLKQAMAFSSPRFTAWVAKNEDIL